MTPRNSYVTVTDQFCGAGGSSQGAAWAGAEVRLALNHWQLAIETHNTNFPDVLHDCADISATDPRRYPSTDILITSPECTNHSLAKGRKRKNAAQLDLWGKNGIDPAEERSRATMWDVPRFAEFHDYNAIIVENVVDARRWMLFDDWLRTMHTLGYDHQIVYLNSMFFHPTPQSRDRMYIVFTKSGNHLPDLDFRPAAFCPTCEKDVQARQSWKKPEKIWGRYGARRQYVYRCPHCQEVVEPYYYAAANAIDWSLEGQRIGDRDRPLKPRTLERIQYGLDKFGRQATLVQLDHTHSKSPRSRPLTEPMTTQTSRQVVALVEPLLMSYYSREDATRPVSEAMGTVTTEPRHALVQPPYIINIAGPTEYAARGIDDPLPTQVTTRTPGLIEPPPFIVELRNNATAREITDALSTVTTSGAHHGLVLPPPSPYIINIAGPTEYAARGVDDPLPTQVTTRTPGLILPFIQSYYGGSHVTSGIDEPVGTQSTRERHALVEAALPELRVEDCRFRMLQPHEIQRAMAFHDEYVVLGTKKEQVKQLGNAVTPPVMQWLVQQVLATFAA